MRHCRARSTRVMHAATVLIVATVGPAAVQALSVNAPRVQQADSSRPMAITTQTMMVSPDSMPKGANPHLQIAECGEPVQPVSGQADRQSVAAKAVGRVDSFRIAGRPEVSGGSRYATFTAGDIDELANGDVVSMAGKLLEKFAQLGGAMGRLGLPLAGQYLVPGGMRQDFQNGSLIFNQVTDTVTTVIKTYTNAYTKEYNDPNSTGGR